MLYLEQSVVRKTMVFGILIMIAALLAVLGISRALADEPDVDKVSEKKTERDFGFKRGKHHFSIEDITAKIQIAVEGGQLTQAEADEKISIIEKGIKNGFEPNQGFQHWKGKHQFSIGDITAKIQALVEDGQLSQAEADEKIKKIQGKWGK